MLIKYKEVFKRLATILKVEEDNKPHLSFINNFIQVRYSLKNHATIDDLKDAQINSLIRNIHEK
ncbi:hypothetical protein NUSPORA_00707 [Nucleospora cyclopteri]